jgi:hypothetical protein
MEISKLAPQPLRWYHKWSMSAPRQDRELFDVTERRHTCHVVVRIVAADFLRNRSSLTTIKKD